MASGSVSRIAVAHVVHSMGVGGMERVVVSLMQLVSAEEFSSTVYCLASGGEFLELVKEEGFRTRVLSKKSGVSVSLPLRLAKILRKDRIDIVHCHNLGGLTYGATAGWLAGVRGTIYTAHGPEFPCGKRQIMFQRLPLVDRIVAVSDYLRKDAIEGAGIDPQKVMTIRNGVDVDGFSPRSPEAIREKRRELGLATEHRAIGVVARLSPEKDHATLIEAFAKVSRARVESRLIVVGDGELLPDLQQKCRTLGIESSVMFLGLRKDVADLLSVFDVFALSSSEEGLGITLLEAMAAAVPVVATSVGGIPEIVRHGLNGVTVPAGDPVPLADAILWLLDSPDRAQSMGERGRRWVTEFQSVRRMVTEYEILYRNIAKR